MKILTFWLMPLTLLFVLSCSNAEKKPNLSYDPNTDAGLYNLSDYLSEQGRFEEAIANLNNLRRQYPYSRYTTQAELKIADIQYERDFFPEAEAAYKSFLQLHPKHPMASYVTYQVGASYFNQLPNTNDRDLSLAYSALFYFNKTIREFPGTSHAQAAQRMVQKTRRKLASKEEYIANFYFIREHYLSAFKRYDKLISKNLEFLDELKLRSLYRATVSAFRSKQLEDARKHFLLLEKNYPNDALTVAAKKELTNGTE